MDATRGRIRLLRPLRFGPAVEVWEAHLSGRRVLARRFPPEGPPPGWPPPPDPEVLRAMNHPVLQRFRFETRDEDGWRVQVFSWYRGDVLENFFHRGAIVTPNACRAIVHFGAAALRWLHERGPFAPVLHGDVSPGNLMVIPRGFIWLDVLAIRPGHPPGGPGVVFGTLPYLAPEVLAREPPREASEVFSLGLIALRALTGSLPWAKARSPSEVLAWHEREPPELRIPETPPGWSALSVAVLRAMLSPNPALRPSASEVVRAFPLESGRPSGRWDRK